MEELGIGRPSTYASILTVLRDRNYVRLENRRFIPEDRGRLVTAFLTSFFERYVDTGFTAALEEQLDDISGGRADWREVMRAFWEEFSRAVEQTKDLKISDVIAALDEDLGPHFFPPKADGADPRVCPACGNGRLGLKLGRYGSFIGCSNYPACQYTRRLAIENGEDQAADTLKEGMRALGAHPETGEEITVRRGPYGLYVQQGEPAEKEKPRRASLPRGMEGETITLEQAVGLLSLPRIVGMHPEFGETIEAGIGRFGPYVKMGAVYGSLDRDDDVLAVGLNRAVDVLAKKLASVRTLGNHPKDGQPVVVKKGRFGPYFQHGQTVANIPRGKDMEEVTLEEAVALLAEKGKQLKGRGGKKPPARKPAKAEAAPKAARRRPRRRKPAAGQEGGREEARAQAGREEGGREARGAAQGRLMPKRRQEGEGAGARCRAARRSAASSATRPAASASARSRGSSVSAPSISVGLRGILKSLAGRGRRGTRRAIAASPRRAGSPEATIVQVTGTDPGRRRARPPRRLGGGRAAAHGADGAGGARPPCPRPGRARAGAAAPDRQRAATRAARSSASPRRPAGCSACFAPEPPRAAAGWCRPTAAPRRNGASRPARKARRRPGEIVLAEPLGHAGFGLKPARIVERLGRMGDARSVCAHLHRHRTASRRNSPTRRWPRPSAPAPRRSASARICARSRSSPSTARMRAISTMRCSPSRMATGWRLIVAIADVAHYVRPGSRARPRGLGARQLRLFPRPRRADAARGALQRLVQPEARRGSRLPVRRDVDRRRGAEDAPPFRPRADAQRGAAHLRRRCRRPRMPAARSGCRAAAAPSLPGVPRPARRAREARHARSRPAGAPRRARRPRPCRSRSPRARASTATG